jgi:nucleotide-binding universal stress UspA family protein
MQEALRRLAGNTRRRYHGLRRRFRRIERREIREFRGWLEHTGHLQKLSVLLFVPLLIAVVTLLSESVTQISFLLFPPLASGTYTLFADPEGEHSSPRRFVGGLTVGAFSGWVALEIAAHFLYHVTPAAFQVRPGAAALGVLLTGLATWALDLELPTAYSTGLLVLITGTSQFAYVVSVLLSSTLVAGVFVIWREEIYEQRARYLYQTTNADDHVLVPMRGEHPWWTALFGARLAAAHDAGEVVLLDVVDDEAVARAERATLEHGDAEAEIEDAVTEEEAQAVTESARVLEADADRIETKVGVPCDVVVAVSGEDRARTALDAAERTNCDLVVTPYEEQSGRLAPFVRGLFDGDVDVVAFRSVREVGRWRRILVPVRRAGDAAHAMADYAERLAGAAGTVALCTCIADEDRRRQAETMLANLAETVTVPCETRVPRTDLARFLRRNQSVDLVVMGASTDRSAASRFLSPPTFRRVMELETDVAVVHKA